MLKRITNRQIEKMDGSVKSQKIKLIFKDKKRSFEACRRNEPDGAVI